MPFKSKKQSKACFATRGFAGKVNCKEWAKKTDYSKLQDGGPICYDENNNIIPCKVNVSDVGNWWRPKPEIPTFVPPTSVDGPDHEDYPTEAPKENPWGPGKRPDTRDDVDKRYENDKDFREKYDQSLKKYDQSLNPNGSIKSKKIDPYFWLRGATTGLSWLSGMVERNRQDDYARQQYNLLGQLDPIPVENFQPVNYNPYAQQGGTPIYTTDKNDPRLRAYNDSLTVYNDVNKFNSIIKKYDNDISLLPDEKHYLNKEHKKAVKIVNENKWKVNNVTNPDNFLSPFGSFQKPVQPIIYKPEEKKLSTKRIPANLINSTGDISNSIIPSRGSVEVPNLPDLPYRVEYDGTNHQNFVNEEASRDFIEELKKRPQGIPFGVRGYYDNKYQGGGTFEEITGLKAIKSISNSTDNNNLRKPKQEKILTEKEKQALIAQKSIQNQGSLKGITKDEYNASPSLTSILKNPMTALKLKMQGQQLPSNLDKAPRNPYDNALDIVNPMTYGVAAKNTVNNILSPDKSVDIVGKAITNGITQITDGVNAYDSEYNNKFISMLGDAAMSAPVLSNINNVSKGLAKLDDTELLYNILKNKSFKPTPLTSGDKELIKTIRNVGSMFSDEAETLSSSHMYKILEKSKTLDDVKFENLTGYTRDAYKQKAKLAEQIEPHSSKINIAEMTNREEDIAGNLINNSIDLGRLRNNESLTVSDITNIINNSRQNYNLSNLDKPLVKEYISSKDPSVLSEILNKISPVMVKSPMKPTTTLLPSLYKKVNQNPAYNMLQAYKTVKNAQSGERFIPAHSLSSDSYPMSLALIKKAAQDDLVDINFHGFTSLNQSGYLSRAEVPENLMVNEANEIIKELNKKLKKKIPLASVSKGFPQLTVIRKQSGGITNPYKNK